MLKPPHQSYSVEGWLGYGGIVLINGIRASMTKTPKICIFPAIIEHYDKIFF